MSSGIGVPAGHARVPARTGEQGQPIIDGHQVDRTSVAASQDLHHRIGLAWHAEQVGRRVAESGRDPAQGQIGATGGHRVGDAERAIAPGDDGGRVVADPLSEPVAELPGIARRDGVDLGVERDARCRDRAPHTIRPSTPGCLVVEDGRAAATGHSGYGNAARTSSRAPCGEPPTAKTVSPLTYR